MHSSSKLGLVVGSGLGVGVGVVVGSGGGDGVGVGVGDGVGVGSSVSSWIGVIDNLDEVTIVVVVSICFVVVLGVVISDTAEEPQNKQSDTKRIVTTSKLESFILDIEDTI